MLITQLTCFRKVVLKKKRKTRCNFSWYHKNSCTSGLFNSQYCSVRAFASLGKGGITLRYRVTIMWGGKRQNTPFEPNAVLHRAEAELPYVFITVATSAHGIWGSPSPPPSNYKLVFSQKLKSSIQKMRMWHLLFCSLAKLSELD